ncbi:unnamed protein product [Closterium sp. Naga37s-1]|nr:unnamed protein product [Closterium sp. Naga37s-1]
MRGRARKNKKQRWGVVIAQQEVRRAGGREVRRVGYGSWDMGGVEQAQEGWKCKGGRGGKHGEGEYGGEARAGEENTGENGSTSNAAAVACCSWNLRTVSASPFTYHTPLTPGVPHALTCHVDLIYHSPHLILVSPGVCRSPLSGEDGGKQGRGWGEAGERMGGSREEDGGKQGRGWGEAGERMGGSRGEDGGKQGRGWGEAGKRMGGSRARGGESRAGVGGKQVRGWGRRVGGGGGGIKEEDREAGQGGRDQGIGLGEAAQRMGGSSSEDGGKQLRGWEEAGQGIVGSRAEDGGKRERGKQ